MSNTKLAVWIGSGIVAGVAVVCAITMRRRHQTLAHRALKQVTVLKHQASRLGDAAADLIEKGRNEASRQKKNLAEAMEAGKSAYQKIAG